MADLVWLCTTGNTGTTTGDGGTFASAHDPASTCAGGGQWVDVATFVQQGIEFKAADLDPAIIGQSFAASFILVGAFWVVGKSVAVLLSLIGR